MLNNGKLFLTSFEIQMDNFFTSIEQSFTEQENELLSRIEDVKKRWDEIISYDRLIVEKSLDLQKFKNLLTKTNLQILRTKEESLYMELEIVQLSFQIRHLRSEIWRLLPSTNDDTPSIEYHVSSEINESTSSESSSNIQPDPQLEKDYKAILAKWEELTQSQRIVFQEEKSHRQSDSEYFQRFINDFEEQASQTHHKIAHQMSKLAYTTSAVKEQATSLLNQHCSRLSVLEDNENEYKKREHHVLTEGYQRAFEERAKAQEEASLRSNLAREKIKAIERQNINAFQLIADKDNLLQKTEKEAEENVAKLKKLFDTLQKGNRDYLEKGQKKIEELEAKLNALMSASAAIDKCPPEEQRNIMKAVSAAFTLNASAAVELNTLHMEIQNSQAKLKRRSQLHSSP